MKTLIAGLMVVAALLLAGCDSLTQYSLSEQQINQSLQQRVHFSKQIGLPGIANATLTLTDLRSQIGREEPGKIVLTGQADLVLSTFFGDQQASLQLKLKTQPMFDRQQGAIYLRELQISQSDVTPPKMEKVLAPLLPYLNQALRQYFEQTPAWQLDPAHSKLEALAKKYAEGMTIKPGEVVLKFGL